MENMSILALDQGTTSSRAILFDQGATMLGECSIALTQHYPKPGWVEHDPVEILNSQVEAMRRAVADGGDAEAVLDRIQCVGIANQRETVLLWNRETGKPLANAIVWQCRRTADLCAKLTESGWAEKIRQKTGLVVDAYFSGTKIKWLLDHIPEARALADAGKLLAGTVDTWLIWNLTEEQRHVTDYSNASRTMLFNIHELRWDMDLLELLDIPVSIMPEVVPSSGVVGMLKQAVLGRRVPISGIAGDQQAALFGQNCFLPGSAKCTYGTGCFLLMNTGSQPVFSSNNLLTTIAWGIGDDVEYALEGSVFHAGSVIRWLQRGLGLIDKPEQVDIDSESVADNGGLYIVPALTGIGAPYWDPFAGGLMIGITAGTKREHISRAVLESIAYQCTDIFSLMAEDSGIPVREVLVDGGVSVSNFLMQFQADMTAVLINRPRIKETTALGAAELAGLGVGLWKDKQELVQIRQSEAVFKPIMAHGERDKLYQCWKKAVERSLTWGESGFER